MGGAAGVVFASLVGAVYVGVLVAVTFWDAKKSEAQMAREAAELNPALAAVAERTGLRYVDGGPGPGWGSLRGARDGVETRLSIESDEDETFMRIEVVAPAGVKLHAKRVRAALAPASLPPGVKATVDAMPDRLSVVARDRHPRSTFLRTRSFPLDAETIHRLIEACVAAVTSSH